MLLRNSALVLFLIGSALTLRAQSQIQTAPATPKANSEVAATTTNYDEAKVGNYNLPDALTLNDG